MTGLLRREAARDPRGSVTATYVKDELGVSGADAITALGALEGSGFVASVIHDVCDCGHVGHDVIDDPQGDRGRGFCADCTRETEHWRYVLYRFTPALRERDGDPKAPRRRAPRYPYRMAAAAAR